MGKKNRIAASAAAVAASAAAAETASASAGNNRQMEYLKTENARLVKKAVECRKQIKELRFQITSMAEDADIFPGIERDIDRLVLSSSLREAAANRTAEMAAATEREKNQMKKAESAIAEMNDAETELLALVREKDATEIEVAELKESLLSMEQARDRVNPWEKWVYPAAAAAAAAAASSIALVIFCRSLKK